MINRRKRFVRPIWSLLAVALVVTGCGLVGRRPTPTPAVEGLVLEGPAEPLECDTPIDSPMRAVIAAQSSLVTTRLEAVEAPMVLSVEELPYADARARIARAEEVDAPVGAGDNVWLVILRGTWQIVPPGPESTPMPAQQQCVFAIINPETCHAFQVGTLACPVP